MTLNVMTPKTNPTNEHGNPTPQNQLSIPANTAHNAPQKPVNAATTRVDEELDGKYFALAEMLRSIGKDIEKIKDEEGLS